MQQTLEEVNTLKRRVADLENGTHNLTEHLLVDKNDILFIINDISHFRSHLPNLCPELIHDVVQNFFIRNQIYLGHDDDDRYFERKGDTEIV